MASGSLLPRLESVVIDPAWSRNTKLAENGGFEQPFARVLLGELAVDRAVSSPNSMPKCTTSAHLEPFTLPSQIWVQILRVIYGVPLASVKTLIPASHLWLVNHFRTVGERTKFDVDYPENF